MSFLLVFVRCSREETQTCQAAQSLIWPLRGRSRDENRLMLQEVANTTAEQVEEIARVYLHSLVLALTGSEEERKRVGGTVCIVTNKKKVSQKNDRESSKRTRETERDRRENFSQASRTGRKRKDCFLNRELHRAISVERGQSLRQSSPRDVETHLQARSTCLSAHLSLPQEKERGSKTFLLLFEA